MELEMEMVDQLVAEEASAVERMLDAAAGIETAAARLEAAVKRLAMGQIAASASLELEQKLKAAEGEIAQLKAAAQGGRKTLAAGTMMAREGAVVDSGALDQAFACLSVEQRIAVKAQMIRGGLLG